jgi:DNA-binding PadR family transcriptional regulator
VRRPRPRLLVLNDPRPMRIDRSLAAEIGLAESIVLLQLEFLISIAQHERDGRLWTYQSLEDLRTEHFPWWSIPTISRILKRLEDLECITIGNFNRVGHDRTQWYTLNEEGINRLASVRFDEPAIFQNEKWKRSKRKMEGQDLQNGFFDLKDPIDQNEKSILQNVTTLPETSPEISTKTSPETPPPERQVEEEIADLLEQLGLKETP